MIKIIITLVKIIFTYKVFKSYSDRNLAYVLSDLNPRQFDSSFDYEKAFEINSKLLNPIYLLWFRYKLYAGKEDASINIDGFNYTRGLRFDS